MDFRDDIAANLPPPHDDEPESLRQDIIDELSDHLQCSLQRELLSSGRRESLAANPEQTARQTVLTRFGNPASIARRLWWDAMKETIMAQRFTAVMATITAAAVVAVTVLFWRFVDQQTQTAVAIHESNTALLDRLIAALEQKPTPVSTADQPVSADKDRKLHHVKLRLVLDEPGGPPAVGYSLSPAGVSDDEDLVRLVDGKTDEEGRTTLTMNRIGVFFVSIQTPQGESTTTLIPIGPGHSEEVELVVPSPRPFVENLVIEVPQPDEFKERNYLFDVTIQPQPRTVGNLEWYSAQEWINSQSGGSLRLLVGSDGSIIGRIIRSIDQPNPPAPYQSVVFQTVPFERLSAGDYAVQSVNAYEPTGQPREGQSDRLGLNTNAQYEFGEGTMIKTASDDDAHWTIELPNFVWDRETERQEGTGVFHSSAGAGGGFF